MIGSVFHGLSKISLKVLNCNALGIKHFAQTSIRGYKSGISGIRHVQSIAPGYDENIKLGTKITRAGAVVNLGLSAAKAVAGYVLQSPAMIADAIHSLSDLIGDGITFLSVQHSRKPPTPVYPYGYGRIETIGAMGISFFLIGTACVIGWDSWKVLSHYLFSSESIQSTFSWSAKSVLSGPGVLFLSVVAKEWLFKRTLEIGQQTKSSSLIANAYHHRSDVHVSLVAFAGIAGHYIGMPWLDPVGGIAVGGVIAHMGLKLLRDNCEGLLDKQNLDLNKELFLKIQDRGIACVWLKCRELGAITIVDVRVLVQPSEPAINLVFMEKCINDIVNKQLNDSAQVYLSYQLV